MTFQTADGSGALLQAVTVTAWQHQQDLEFRLVVRSGTRSGIKHHSGRRVPVLASLTTSVHRPVDWAAQGQQPAHWYSSRLSPQCQQVPACQVNVQQSQQCQVQASTLQLQQLHKQQQPPQQLIEHSYHEQQVGEQRDMEPSGPIKSCQDGVAALLASLSQTKLLIAGAMSAVVSRTAMAPLERVRVHRSSKGAIAVHDRPSVISAVWTAIMSTHEGPVPSDCTGLAQLLHWAWHVLVLVSLLQCS